MTTRQGLLLLSGGSIALLVSGCQPGAKQTVQAAPPTSMAAKPRPAQPRPISLPAKDADRTGADVTITEVTPSEDVQRPRHPEQPTASRIASAEAAQRHDSGNREQGYRRSREAGDRRRYDSKEEKRRRKWAEQRWEEEKRRQERAREREKQAREREKQRREQARERRNWEQEREWEKRAREEEKHERERDREEEREDEEDD